jgi:hypothetical protein
LNGRTKNIDGDFSPHTPMPQTYSRRSSLGSRVASSSCKKRRWVHGNSKRALFSIRRWYICPVLLLSSLPSLQKYMGTLMKVFFKTMIKRLREVFYWPKMKDLVKAFIRHCDVCQRHKIETTMPSRLLQLLFIPTKVWVEVLMDFIDGLPKSSMKSTILVVVDRLTKYGHFILISHPYSTAPQIAKVYFDNIFKLHGMPESIV